MKKILAIILAILCCVGCLTACSESEYDKTYHKFYNAAKAYEKAWNSSESLGKYQDKLLDAYVEYIMVASSDPETARTGRADIDKVEQQFPHATDVINYAIQHEDEFEYWYNQSHGHPVYGEPID